MNMAGHRVSDFNSEVGKFFKEKHDDCMASGRPVYTVHRADHAAAVPTWERLILPCIDPRSGIARIFVYMRPKNFGTNV
jgi:hypothetical protein